MANMIKLDLVHRLLGIHAALDDAIGDSDIEHMDNEELRDAHPVQWAATRVAELIAELKR